MDTVEIPGIVSEIGGFRALYFALSVLYIHFIIILLVSGILTMLVLSANIFAQPIGSDSSSSKGRKPLREGGNLFLYCAAFATFGIVTAYFLKLGLDSGTPMAGNTLASTFATPFISLLTAGVAYVAARNRSGIVGNTLVTGVIAFLLACMVSYQTVLEQTHRLAVSDIGGAIEDDDPAISISSEEIAPPSQPQAPKPPPSEQEPSNANSVQVPIEAPRDVNPASSPRPPSTGAAGGL